MDSERAEEDSGDNSSLSPHFDGAESEEEGEGEVGLQQDLDEKSTTARGEEMPSEDRRQRRQRVEITDDDQWTVGWVSDVNTATAQHSTA